MDSHGAGFPWPVILGIILIIAAAVLTVVTY
jgi:hypothetical protein